MGASAAPSRVAALARALEGARQCLVLTHDNPDPDALASAFALRHLLAERMSLPATVSFSGVIGRAENRAMIQTLGLIPEPLSTLDPDAFDTIALVDTQPGTGNNSLPSERQADVVIDHHPVNFDPSSLRYADLREDYGATATILTEYVVAAGLELPRAIATALFYALKSETQDLGRDTGEADRQAYFYLLSRADMRAVASIQRARVPREYFRDFRTAVDRAEVVGETVITELGAVGSADIVSEIADFLHRLQGAKWSCCIGRHHNNVLVSLRTSDPDAHAGRLIRNAVRGIGTAGGHGTMAGGQIPVSERQVESTIADLRVRLLAELGEADTEPEKLIRADPAP